MNVVDLNERRQATHARVLAAIEEQKKVLRAMSKDHPQRYLVESLIKTLRATAARLDTGAQRKRTARR